MSVSTIDLEALAIGGSEVGQAPENLAAVGNTNRITRRQAKENAEEEDRRQAEQEAEQLEADLNAEKKTKRIARQREKEDAKREAEKEDEIKAEQAAKQREADRKAPEHVKAAFEELPSVSGGTRVSHRHILRGISDARSCL